MPPVLSLIADPSAWAAFGALVVMEVVLGVDNLVFVAILTNSLPQDVRARARYLGIGLALVLRLALLGTLVFIVGLTRPVLTLCGHGFSWRDLVLIGGGLFLVWKATREIHGTVDPEAHGRGQADSGQADAGQPGPGRAGPGRAAGPGLILAVVQILALDLVFSIDSILTAVGMTDDLPVMAAAVTVAVGLMMIASGPLAALIRKNPTVVMLALGFLLMIGMTLIADGFGAAIPKGYIYAAMAFSAFVEGLNMLARARRRSVGSRP